MLDGAVRSHPKAVGEGCAVEATDSVTVVSRSSTLMLGREEIAPGTPVRLPRDEAMGLVARGIVELLHEETEASGSGLGPALDWWCSEAATGRPPRLFADGLGLPLRNADIQLAADELIRDDELRLSFAMGEDAQWLSVDAFLDAVLAGIGPTFDMPTPGAFLDRLTAAGMSRVGARRTLSALVAEIIKSVEGVLKGRRCIVFERRRRSWRAWPPEEFRFWGAGPLDPELVVEAAIEANDLPGALKMLCGPDGLMASDLEKRFAAFRDTASPRFLLARSTPASVRARAGGNLASLAREQLKDVYCALVLEVAHEAFKLGVQMMTRPGAQDHVLEKLGVTPGLPASELVADIKSRTDNTTRGPFHDGYSLAAQVASMSVPFLPFSTGGKPPKGSTTPRNGAEWAPQPARCLG